MRLIVISLVLLVIATMNEAIAEDQSVPEGTIYGHVYDAQTKQPISQAFVYCQEAKCKPVATDSEGYYAIQSCFSPSSSYVIECTKSSYPTTKNSVETDTSGKAEADFNLGTPNPPPKPNLNQAQSKSWKRTFGGSDVYGINSVQQTRDGGYIIVGDNSSDYAVNSDVYLIKTDADGNKLWDRKFGGSGENKGYSVQQTNDGGYIIAGTTGSHVPNNQDLSLIKTDIFLIKTDASGNKLWDKAYYRSYDANGNPVQQTVQATEPRLRIMSIEYLWPVLVIVTK